jgi:AAA15 family ATPase/GTPase
MLLDFTVENFRSIKGAETLSAVAASKSKAKSSNSESRRRVKSDDEIAQPFHVEGWDIDILPVIAIFGANASGKSNVLKALDYLLKFMIEGNYDRGAELIPFKLDKEIRESPTCFKLRTIFDETIYTYSLVLNSNRILVEKLEYAIATTKRTRLLFSRVWNEEDQKFDWDKRSAFSGAHYQIRNSLQEREPFTILLVRLNINVVNSLFEWLMRSYLYIDVGQDKIDSELISLIQQYHSSRPEYLKILEETKNLLRKFDIGIHDIEIHQADNNEKFQIYALHKTKDNEIISWKFEEESTGTRILFTLIYDVLISFQKTHLLRSDELGSNIHPNIVREIIKLFQDSKTNPHRTQLIFTSHDNTLQRNNLLRRDQIWFTQKRPDQSTELYPLSDFKVRNDLAIDKAYLDGRFGAVPFISDEDDFMPVGEDNG